MYSYSIAIRTLGTAGDKFRRELESIVAQTVQPEKVIVYIGEGYPRPDFQIGKEEYVHVKKGMVAQRALPYHEIDSDVILFLDDDVWLAPDTAERMVHAMESYNADAVGLDLFHNHELPLKEKLRAALSNMVFPHFGNNRAFKIHQNGSFSYLNRPRKDFYWSQSCAGPAFLIKKRVYNKLHFKDEVWLDEMGYAYNDDTLETYKIYRNGYKLGVLFNTGSRHEDARTSVYNKKPMAEKIRLRSKASFLIWHRAIYSPAGRFGKITSTLSFVIKVLWQSLGLCIYSIIKLKPSIIANYFKGLCAGLKMSKAAEYKKLTPYVDNKA